MTSLKHLFAWTFLTLIFAAFTGPAQAKNDLVIGITQYPSTFHPNIDSMLAKSYVNGLARRPLTTMDARWETVCVLCEELPTLENGGATLEKTPDGKDGIAVTYKIVEEAVWGDGTPITVDDVIFTWEVGKHPKSGVASTEGYRRILSIDRIDDKTFTLHVDRRTFDYNNLSTLNLLPAHIDRAKFAEPEAYKTQTAFDTDPMNPGLYMGPYIMTQAKTGSHMVFERNPKWWGKTPAFDKITVRVIENTTTLEANLLSGGIDMISGELGLNVDQALAFEKRHGRKYNILFKPGLIYEHIDLMLDNPVLQDSRVRQALMYAIDRNAISERLFGGKQPVAHTGVNPLDWVFDETVPKYAFDPAQADRLLNEAGWTKRSDGMRANAAGEPLRFQLMTTAGNRTRELVEQVLQSQWKDAGIAIDIRNEPARVFFGETVTKRKFPAMAMFAWISAPESVPRTTLHSEEIPSEANNWSGQNYTGFKNAEMDVLLEEIELELDRDKRKAMWAKLQNIYATELPALPLYFRANSFILPKWLKGVEPTGHQFPTTLWVENWTVAE
ncbi:MAG: peptide ABC transporter substrate-binding protein [Rhodospirillales bacterium]|nr:peptide ABC transporter substrate-binding protein [Rhodospirillales bacterium]MBO6786980.1 peptide ABC transporter substrate-binding protein [Rhodospirillales bacterium]